MSAYTELTEPVVEHYRKLGHFVQVDGGQPIASITAEIVAAVERMRK
jgi:adenylate kinase